MRKVKVISSAVLVFIWIFFYPIMGSAALFSGHTFGQNSAVLVVDQKGKYLYSKNSDKALIPASTIKVATSIAAIELFGVNHRFSTEFYIHENTLWVKGYGDPFITSEEFDSITLKLQQLLGESGHVINSIRVDGTHFPLLTVPGRALTNNPYDAPLSAVAANFNTINVSKYNGVVKSAEKQTPITPLAKRLSKKLPNGKHRINLKSTENSEKYFAELLVEKLKKRGINVDSVGTGVLPLDVELFYVHKNSKTVEDALRAVLFYSNNFIANQLFLQMRPWSEKVSFDASSRYVRQQLDQHLGPVSERNKAKIIEGSGLSKDNQLTAEQLIAMLIRFQPHKKLMKSYLQGKAYAKSGTLNGVQNLVGYVTKHNKQYYFAFLFNDPVKWRFRNQLLEQLYREL